MSKSNKYKRIEGFQIILSFIELIAKKPQSEEELAKVFTQKMGQE
jgi:hypothetical protein